jgi:hypothetical protein
MSQYAVLLTAKDNEKYMMWPTLDSLSSRVSTALGSVDSSPHGRINQKIAPQAETPKVRLINLVSDSWMPPGAETEFRSYSSNRATAHEWYAHDMPADMPIQADRHRFIATVLRALISEDSQEQAKLFRDSLLKNNVPEDPKRSTWIYEKYASEVATSKLNSAQLHQAVELGRDNRETLATVSKNINKNELDDEFSSLRTTHAENQETSGLYGFATGAAAFLFPPIAPIIGGSGVLDLTIMERELNSRRPRLEVFKQEQYHDDPSEGSK